MENWTKLEFCYLIDAMTVVNCQNQMEHMQTV